MNSGITALYPAPHLRALENRTVLTHGVQTIEELQHFKNLHFYSSGGLMLRNSDSFAWKFGRRFFSSF